MSTATTRPPNFIAAPGPAPGPWGRVRPEIDRPKGGGGDLALLAGFRARLARWDDMTPAQRVRTVRDIGVAVLAHSGGLSHREIAAALAMGPTQVGAAIKSFVTPHGFIARLDTDPDPAEADGPAGGEAAGRGPQGAGPR